MPRQVERTAWWWTSTSSGRIHSRRSSASYRTPTTPTDVMCDCARTGMTSGVNLWSKVPWSQGSKQSAGSIRCESSNLLPFVQRSTQIYMNFKRYQFVWFCFVIRPGGWAYRQGFPPGQVSTWCEIVQTSQHWVGIITLRTAGLTCHVSVVACLPIRFLLLLKAEASFFTWVGNPASYCTGLHGGSVPGRPME